MLTKAQRRSLKKQRARLRRSRQLKQIGEQISRGRTYDDLMACPKMGKFCRAEPMVIAQTVVREAIAQAEREGILPTKEERLVQAKKFQAQVAEEKKRKLEKKRKK